VVCVVRVVLRRLLGVAVDGFVVMFGMNACAGDKIEKNEMGWAYGAYGGGEGGV